MTLAANVCLIGITGAALVFRGEMQKAHVRAVRTPAGSADASPATIASNLQAPYPLYKLLGIDYPTARRRPYLSYLTKGNQLRTAFSDPVSGDVIGELPRTSWITRLQDLHFDLRSGGTGRLVNGIAAVCLVLMFATGLGVWWRGLSRCRRALVVDVATPWARIKVNAVLPLRSGAACSPDQDD